LSCARAGRTTRNVKESKSSLRMLTSQRSFRICIKKYGVDIKKSGAGWRQAVAKRFVFCVKLRFDKDGVASE